MQDKVKRHIWMVLFFFLLTIVVTFPLAFNLPTHILGFFSSDENCAPLWDSWRIKYSFRNNISFTHTPLIAYPFGCNLYSSGYLSYLWTVLFYFLSILTTPMLTYNIQVLANLFLSGVLTYMLVFHLMRNRLSAFFSGLIFAFCPYQFMRAWQHLSLTYNQWIPLCLLTGFLLKKEETKKNFILFLMSLLLLFTFDHSIMYLGTITLTSFFIYIILFKFRIKFFSKNFLPKEDFKFIKRVIIAIFFAAVILAPQFFLVFKNRFNFSSTSIPSAFNPYRRPFEDLFIQSAKPLSYLLPAAVHPVFGKFTERFIGSQLYGDSFTEHTLYLGWIPLILAFVAIRKWRKMRKAGAAPYIIGFFVFLAISAWFFSQPPWWDIFGFKLYMPSFFMYKILPMFRAYCRFGIVVMLAVAVLAGFGLKFILDKFKSKRTRIAVATFFSCLVLFEFWNYPPLKVIDLSRVPQVYYWLKDASGDFVIAEYPLDVDGSSELYKFYQTKHEKKIINGTIPGTYANKVAQRIVKLSEPNTAEVLKWMGVRYALVHREDYLKTEIIDDIEELNKIPQNPELKFIKSFSSEECPDKNIMCVRKTGPIDVYEVIASPREPKM